MTARNCFTAKMAAGTVADRAGRQILDMLDAFEREHQARLGDAAGARQAALEAAAIAKADASRRADETRRALIAQADVLRRFSQYDADVTRLRETPGDLGFGNQAPPSLGKDQSTLGAAARAVLARDPWEIAKGNNVDKLADFLRAKAHAQFAEAIEFLRPKVLGLKAETVRELDVLRGLFGRADVEPQAKAAAQAFEQTQLRLADDYIAAGGQLAKRKDWRLPAPELDIAKARALGPERYAQLRRDTVDRDAMIDFATGERMSDARFEQLLAEHVNDAMAGFVSGPPSGAVKGRRMLANSRDHARVFPFKDDAAWLRFAETVGAHASPYQAMLDHISAITRDTALLRMLGPNPQAWKRFVLDLFDREAARLAVEADASSSAKGVKKAVIANKATEARVAAERRLFENLFAEVTGENRIPANSAIAEMLGSARAWLSATQLGSALISSITDSGTTVLAARMNGIPAMDVVARATAMMGEKGSEIFAAQQGLLADTLASAVHQGDRVMGETIRTGLAAKLAGANIRAQGLRRWTVTLRNAFALEMMAHVARQRAVGFPDLDPTFRAALDRYGIGAADWDAIRATEPAQPRPNALLLRPMDVAADGASPAVRDASEKYARLVMTEMDFAVIDGDPVTRAMILGQSRPGTLGGEVRRSASMYRSFPLTFITLHMARAFSRGWDGSRIGHAAMTFAAMTALGTVAMQAKEILAGRDPLSLDPTTANGLRAFGKATLQGGGLGVFGDLLFVDQTKYGNSWAAIAAGPLASTVEKTLGDFVFKNIQIAAEGRQTHFLGDAAYALGGLTPGSSLWFARLAFQREVMDRLHVMADPRAPERFARIERAAADRGQRYFARPGRPLAEARAPDFGAVFGP